MVAALLECGTAAAASPAAGPCTTQTYVVPAGVHQLAIRAVGQAGRNGAGYDVGGVTLHGGGDGGLGAAVTNSVAVTPGQTLYAGVASPALAGGTGGGVYYSGGVLPAVGARGGNGTFVTSSRPDETDCSFDPTSILIVAGGGGGGGHADRAGPGGTGGAAGAPGNPGGQNEDSAGAGGGAGGVFTAGTGGAAGLVYEAFFVCPTCRHRSSGHGGDGGKAGSGVGVDRAGSVGGTGGSNDNQSGYYGQPGGGGGGGIFGGGGGGGSGAGFNGQGSGAGGGGGGGSYPVSDAHPTTDAPSVSFTPTYDTTTALTSSVNPSEVGQSVTFTAQVSPTPGRQLTGGYVSFFDQGNVADPARQTVILADVVPVTLDGSGASATATVSTLSAGPHLISASYSGYGVAQPGSSTVEPDAKSSARITQVVASEQTVAFTSDPGIRGAFGATYTPTATATSGLPVSFSIDPSSASVCTIQGSVVSFIAAGSCVIDADQGGNDMYLAASQVQQRVTVLGGQSQVITFTSTPPADFTVNGPAYTPAAIGGRSGQPVVFSVDPGPCVIHAGEVYAAYGGPCTVHANQAGGNGYDAAAQVDQVVTVQPQAQKVLFTSTAPTDPVTGDVYLVKATTDSGQAARLSLDPTSTGCTLTDVRPGTGYNTWQGTVTYTGVGTCVIDGDSPAVPGMLTAAPTARQRSTVLAKPQAIIFTSTDPATPTYGSSYDVSATGGASNNPVTFTSATPATCTIAATTVSFVGAGTCTIHADQAGDSTYAAAPTATKTLIVHPSALVVAGPTAQYVYGAVPNVFTPSYDGLVNGDTAASLSVRASCALATSTSDAGHHTITCSGASDPNYTFTYVAGVATVVAAPLTITASDGSFSYGAAPPPITFAYSGLVNGDTAAAIPPRCHTAPTASSSVGSYASSCHDAADPNYDIRYVDGTVTIVKASQTITFAGPSSPVSYGDAPITVGASASSALAVSLTAAGPCSVSGSTLTVTGAGVCVIVAHQSGNTNYSAAPDVTRTVTVSPAALTVTAPSPSIPYGQPIPMLAPIYGGFVNGDTEVSLTTQATCATTATSLSTPGTYPVICLGAVGSSYTYTYEAGVLTVTKAATTTRMATANPPAVNQATTLTATVEHAGGGAAPTATVSFYDATTLLGAAPVQADGTATLVTTFGGGPHSISAIYSGDSRYLSSTSTPPIPMDVHCDVTITGTRAALTVASGTTCLRNATIAGGISARRGAVLDVEDSTVSGSIVAASAAGLRICGSNTGSVAVAAARGYVRLGDPADNCRPNTISGGLTAAANRGGGTISGNTITGKWTITHNAPTFTAVGNHH